MLPVRTARTPRCIVTTDTAATALSANTTAAAPTFRMSMVRRRRCCRRRWARDSFSSALLVRLGITAGCTCSLSAVATVGLSEFGENLVDRPISTDAQVGAVQPRLPNPGCSTRVGQAWLHGAD